MESQPQNPEFWNNPVNFHLCINGLRLLKKSIWASLQDLDFAYVQMPLINAHDGASRKI